MKKHPVDDLFKRKLEGLERTPSENAWLKIQEKQPARRHGVVWGWYAAAGVAAAVMGGYLVWQNQQVNVPDGIRPQETIAVEKPVQQDSSVYPLKNSNAPIEQLAATEERDYEVLNKQKDLKPAIRVSKIAGTQSTPKHVQEISVAESAQAEPLIAIAEKLPEVPVNSIQPEPIKNPVVQGIKTLPDEPAVSRVNKPEAEPTRTIVVAVETGISESEEKPRNTRFARVFRQLKNARAGEKVDWDEVGFNPKNLVARVDDRLRSKEDRSAEKDHPKDKTKL